jgi:very-short-patch-repair endonuclease
MSAQRLAKVTPTATFQWHLAGLNISEPVLEHRFHPERKWRFDFAWPHLMVAVEIDGGTWTGGRHTRGTGYEADCEKINEATALGWKVFRFTSSQVQRGEAALFIAEKVFQVKA